MKEDTLSYIRNNKEITFEQKIRLVIMLSLPTILAQVSSIIMPVSYTHLDTLPLVKMRSGY